MAALTELAAPSLFLGNLREDAGGWLPRLIPELPPLGGARHGLLRENRLLQLTADILSSWTQLI